MLELKLNNPGRIQRGLRIKTPTWLMLILALLVSRKWRSSRVKRKMLLRRSSLLPNQAKQ